jgi:hypothetical protein
MGCDIHMRAEARINGRWRALDGFPHRYYDPTARFEKDGWSKSFHSSPTTPEPFGDRNYVVFSVLADVRNGGGAFLSGTYVTPISEPKGLPDDLSMDHVGTEYVDAPAGESDERETKRKEGESAQEFAERCWLFGDHSFTWLSLRELLEYDFEQVTTHHGVITYEEWLELAPGRKAPTAWCGGVSGDGIYVGSEADATTRKAGQTVFTPDDRKVKVTHVQYSWDVPLSTYCRRLIDLIDDMKSWRCGKDHREIERGIGPAKWYAYAPDDVRLVFGFDS